MDSCSHRAPSVKGRISISPVSKDRVAFSVASESVDSTGNRVAGAPPVAEVGDEMMLKLDQSLKLTDPYSRRITGGTKGTVVKVDDVTGVRTIRWHGESEEWPVSAKAICKLQKVPKLKEMVTPVTPQPHILKIFTPSSAENLFTPLPRAVSPPRNCLSAGLAHENMDWHSGGSRTFSEAFQALHSRFLEEALILHRQSILAEIGKDVKPVSLSTVSLRPPSMSKAELFDMNGVPVYEEKISEAPRQESKQKPQGKAYSLQPTGKTPHSNADMPDYLSRLIAKLHGRELLMTPLERFVDSSIYNWVVTLAVFAQAIVIGIVVQLEMKYQEHRLSGESADEVPEALFWINAVLHFFFVIDVVFRIAVLRAKFFLANNLENRCWNWFDFCVALACIPDYGAIDFAFVRVFRLLRVIRILRVEHTVPSLRKMILALLHSLSSLVPLAMLLFLLLYMFALVFMQGAIADLKDKEYIPGNSTANRRLAARSASGSIYQDCDSYQVGSEVGLGIHYPFRDLGAAVESLFTLVTGDGDYEKILRPIMNTSAFYKMWGIFFSIFFFFGFVNAAIGLFVDKAMQIASHDRDMALLDAMRRQDDDSTFIKQLFQTADLHGNGSLMVDELRTVVNHPGVKSWLASIDLDLSDDFDAVVQLLDPDDTGSIESETFYQHIGRLRGPAKRLETSLGLMESRAAASEVRELLQRLQQRFSKTGSFTPRQTITTPRQTTTSSSGSPKDTGKLGHLIGQHEQRG